MAAKTVGGNVGGLPKLKVYALKFGIHVGREGRPPSIMEIPQLESRQELGVDSIAAARSLTA